MKKKQYNHSWIIFQPHTYSRTKNLLDDFAKCLTNFDNIIVNTNNILLIKNTIFKEKIVFYLNSFFYTNLSTYLNSRAPPFNS